MKQNLSVFLGLVCAVLVIALIAIKWSGNAQHEKDAGAITDYSNQLFSVQTEVAICHGKLSIISNQFDTCQSASLTLSNQFTEAQSALAAATEQVTDLKRQATQSESEKQTLSQRITELTTSTNQVAELTSQIAATQAGLDQANKDYALLENRFRRDVAERVVMERKFNNRWALQSQLEYLKWNPATEISAETIYAGLDVVAKSNSVYVITPN